MSVASSAYSLLTNYYLSVPLMRRMVQEKSKMTAELPRAFPLTGKARSPIMST